MITLIKYCIPIALLTVTVLVNANPQGATVVNGQVGFATPTANSLTITNTPGAIIDWQSFSINQNEVTQFIQQSSSSSILNRVTGLDPSQIMGQLISNGKVFLINPNGIVFGPDSIVDTAGLIASSLNMTNQDFIDGNLKFEGDADSGSIQSQGYIKAGENGELFLIAPNIENSGILETEGGQLILAAGEKITIASLDFEDVVFEVQSPANEVINLGELVSNGGAASLFAGTIIHSGSVNVDSISVDTQGQVVFSAINDITMTSTALITANGPQGGSIHIQSETGTTLVSGTVQAAGAISQGGKIQILGENVGLVDSAVIDASGETGGGEILVGGDYLGGNTEVKNAKGTYVSELVEITADSLSNGDGGKVIVWADDATRMYGRISARGGAEGGNGGFIETSGHYLDLGDYTPDASSPFGDGGLWLIDPFNLTIQAFADGADDNSGTTPNFVAGATGAILTTETIEAALNVGTSVTIATSGGGGEPGIIYINDDIAKTAGGDTTLTFNADSQIQRTTAASTDETLNITSTVGQLNLSFNAPTTFIGSGTGTLTLNLDTNGGVITFPTLTLQNVDATISGATTVGTLTTYDAAGTRLVTFNDNLTATNMAINAVSYVNLNGAANTTDNLTLVAADLGGTGKLSVSTLLTASSGASSLPSLSDSFTLETLAGSITNIANNFSWNDSSVWNNAGTINWTGGFQPRMYLYGTSIFNNQIGGVFNDNSNPGSGQLTGISGQWPAYASQFINAGTFNKNGTDETYIQGPKFVNTGTVNVNAGTVHVYSQNNPGTNDTGDYIVTGTAVLNFVGQRSFSASSSISSTTAVFLSPGIGQTYTLPSGASFLTPDLTIGSGNVVFDAGSTFNVSNSLTTSGGNLTINTANFTLPTSLIINTGSLIFNSGIANPTVSNLTITGSSLLGTDDLTVSNLFNWSGGTVDTDINLSGTTSITGNVRIDQIFTNSGTMNIGANYSSDDGSLINNSTVNWTAGNIIELGGLASITNNGTFNISGDNANGIDFTNNGTFSKTAGSATSSFTGSFANAGTVNANSGLLQFNGYTQTAGLTNLNGGNIGETGGTASFNGGTLSGIGTYTAGDLNINAATLSPGASPGTLNVVGNLNLGSVSTTLVELGGINQGVDYDFINVTGNVSLDGILDINMFGGFTGIVGNTFDVIESGGTMSGTFATVNIPTGYSFNTGIIGNLYQLGTLSLPVSTSPETSGIINIDEILVLEENFDSWTLDDVYFTENESDEEYDEQVLICS